MYLGQYHLNLENDHRLAIPAGFRDIFAQGAYVTRGFEQNLLIMSEGDFQERYKQVAALNITDPNARLLQRLLLGNASRLEMDASGHVLLPPELISFAGLEKEIILVGQGDHFEAWAPSEWEKQTAILLDTTANTGRFSHLDLTLSYSSRDLSLIAFEKTEDTMSEFEYILATDFDRAWLNFELDLPLKPGPNGEPNRFYVNRPGNPIGELIDALMAPFYRPPKFFFSGHRGCGKSTELLHLMAHPGIQKKYWPVNFSIRDEADIIDLDFRDILLAIGSRMFRDYRKAGGKLPEQLLKELNGWRGKVEEEVKTIRSGRGSYEIGAGIDAFFYNTGLKMKLEPVVRAELRQVFEKDITGLISVINNIATAIYSKEHRIPLILIDDLDKPNLEEARAIFHDRRNIMMQPNCAIIYTVSSALFYTKEFEAIRDQAIFLPNIKLHPHRQPEVKDREGYLTLRRFVHVRIDPRLVDALAIEEAISNSGGVFREMARIMRTAIGRARRRRANKVEYIDVEWATTEIRNEYRRILDKTDIEILKRVHQENRLEYDDRLRPLLQLLAVLEYRNGENWCDIHPVLRRLIE